MTTKHTPAPWNYVRLNENTVAIRGKTNTGESIAKLTFPFMDGEGIANAQLISAAPELLDALKALFANCSMVHTYWGDGDNTKQADEAIKAALAAIEKAEGQ